MLACMLLGWLSHHHCCICVAPRLPLPDASQPLRLLALDCEMCATASDSKALLQVALLDQQGAVLLKVCCARGAHRLCLDSERRKTALHCFANACVSDMHACFLACALSIRRPSLRCLPRPALQTRQALVRPPEPVTDFRSELTGITAADLAGVTDDRAAVAARVAALLTPGTVLVGHSLHYDLEALHLDHQPVIDTAMLFSYM